MSGNKTHSLLLISESIDLKKLERESYPWLYLGTVLGVIIHVILGVLFTVEIQQPLEQSQIPIELIIRSPRPRTPFVLRELPLTRNYLYRSRHRSRQPSKSLSAKLYKSLPDTDITPQSQFRFYEDSIYSATDEFFELFDRSLWLHELTVPFRQGLIEDTGDYTARVIVDPLNKKAIEGHAKIAYIWGWQTDPPDGFNSTASHLCDMLAQYTNISAKPVVVKDSGMRGHREYYPFAYISADNLHNHPNPEKALLSAGFLMIDNGRFDYGLTVTMEEINALLQRAFKNSLTMRALNKSHPIYHCFFDFNNGPPQGVLHTEKRILTGIYMGTHLIGVFCPQGYGEMWKDNMNTPQRRLGVNLAVYALAPGRWIDDDTRISFQDIATGDLTMWHDNGKARFKASQRGKVGRRKRWVPDSERIISYIVNNNSSDTPFNPQLVITHYLFNIDEIGEKLPWGRYNIYEAWYYNGQKVYYYNYNGRMFSEWDEHGHVLAKNK